ncbi:hypothetical protein MTO96_012190 [Rhipicephalus appendiculatus]
MDTADRQAPWTLRDAFDAPFEEDVGRLLVAQHIRGRRPYHRVAAGNSVRLLPLRGLSRADLCLLLRLIICCHRAAERIHRLTGRGSPYCADCGDPESLAYLLLHRTALYASTSPMVAGFARLGLPRSSTKHLLFPECGRGNVKPAFSVLLVFLDDSGLRERK